MNRYLAIDTSSSYLTVLVCGGGEPVCIFEKDGALQHSVRLMDAVDEAFSRAGMRPQDCDFFCAVTGPGSFTGIRIGVSAVKGFCEGTGKPALGRKSAAKTFVYRIHDEPNQEKLENLRGFVGNFGYTLGQMNSGREISKELNRLFAEAKDKPEFNAIELLSLRTMAKARYSTDNIGHYGLAFKYYTHFTSPIRRYPDMMVHRLLAMYLNGEPSQKKDYYEGLCKYASDREIVAAEAERSSVKYKLVEFMQDKVGYEFEGHISGLTEWGMYVEIEPTKIEGMVALRDIRSDFYEFDEEKYRIVGRSSKMVYNLGDPVKIRVKKANLEQKLLDYELVETGLEDRLTEQEASDFQADREARKAARKEKTRREIKASKKRKARLKK